MCDKDNLELLAYISLFFIQITKPKEHSNHALTKVKNLQVYVYIGDQLLSMYDDVNVTVHSFAGDTQLCLHCCRKDITMTAAQLNECIVNVTG